VTKYGKNFVLNMAVGSFRTGSNDNAHI